MSLGGVTSIIDAWIQTGVTNRQFCVLLIIKQDGQQTTTSLSRRLKVCTPTVTGIVDRLVKQGVVQRLPDANDRRVIYLGLTPFGEDLLQSLSFDENRGAAS